MWAKTNEYELVTCIFSKKRKDKNSSVFCSTSAVDGIWDAAVTTVPNAIDVKRETKCKLIFI